MNKIQKEELAYTAMMVFGMATIMLSYNALWAAGWSVQALYIFALGFIPTYITAFIIEKFFVSQTVHKLHKIIVSPHDSKFKFVVVMALLFVTFMAAIMSFVGTVVTTGVADNFWYNYLLNFMRNWPVALIAQLIVVGPIVRAAHMHVFRKSKLVE